MLKTYTVIMFLVGVLLNGQEVQNLKRDVQAPFDVNGIIERVSPYRIETADKSTSANSPVDQYNDNDVKLEIERSYISSPLIGESAIFRGGISDGESIRDGEFLIDTSVSYIPANEDQETPAIAFDGTNYLIVWQDDRDLFTSDYDIYGVRVSLNGAILDPVGFVISKLPYAQCRPSVAFDGQNYLVVWMDARGGSNYDIYGVRISPAGILLDSAGFVISANAYEQAWPALAFNGTNYLVVWHEFHNLYADLYGARVSPAGVVLDPLGILISAAPFDQAWPSVDTDGKEYLVAWLDSRSGTSSDIYGARISESGFVLDPQGLAIAVAFGEQANPAVTFGNTHYLVTWQDNRTGSWDIYCSRVSPAGRVLDPSGIIVSNAMGSQTCPGLAFDGRYWFAAWEDFRNGTTSDIYGAHIAETAIVLEPLGIPICTAPSHQWVPALVFDGRTYRIVWEDKRNGAYRDIYGVRVAQSGQVLEHSVAMANIANLQTEPVAAFDGTNYLVVWQDNRFYPDFDLYAIRVSPSGTVIEPGLIVISNASGNQTHASIAFDGTNYLIVWQDSRNGYDDIYGARVSTQGYVLDPDGLSIISASGSQSTPALAFDGTNYFVVWRGSSGMWAQIYGARVSPTGQVLDPNGIALVSNGSDQSHPSIVFGTTDYLVVWQNFVALIWFDICGTRVTTAGTVLDPSGIPISIGQDEETWYPSVACDGTNFFVVWQDNRNDFYNIYGTRVSASGSIIDSSAIAISTVLTLQKHPCIAFDGMNYLVVWEDGRNGLLYNSDIYAAQINPAGVIINSFPISLQLGNQLSPSLVRGLNSQILVTYAGWTNYINSHPASTMRIWGKFHPWNRD